MWIAGAVAITDPAIVAGFGRATGPVLVDNVQCIGNETRLTNCYHNGVGTHNCFHSDDVGVSCQLREFSYQACIYPLALQRYYIIYYTSTIYCFTQPSVLMVT